jgi:hypothetical protein
MAPTDKPPKLLLAQIDEHLRRAAELRACKEIESPRHTLLMLREVTRTPPKTEDALVGFVSMIQKEREAQIYNEMIERLAMKLSEMAQPDERRKPQ